MNINLQASAISFCVCVVKGSILFLLTFTCSSVTAQVIPDQTLPVNSLVNNENNTNLIEGGTQAGNNLFHSFEKFSVLTGDTAFFNNSANIQNIISRVTGSSISNIDGLIKANGTANLFLINPNGIIFGQNARLEIGGSFLGTTADSINFIDGTFFSAKNPNSNAILSVNVPLGLQFGNNPGTINVENTGHTQLVLSNQGAASITLLGTGESQNGLRLQPGKTFALIGGEVVLNGGVITAPSGRIELGSVNSSTVNLTPTLSGWSFNYEGVSNFSDINLTKQSLLDASGNEFGDIHIQGKNIYFTDGSLALIANFGSSSLGAIRIDAFDTLDMTGVTSFNETQPFLSPIRINRGIVTSTEFGQGADVFITAKKVIGRDSTTISLLTFGAGDSGNLTINSAESVAIFGTALNETSGVSSVFQTVTYGSGQAGNVNLSTKNLLIEDGGTLQSLTSGDGKGGHVNVNVTEVLKLSGGATNFILSPYLTEPIPTFTPSSIASLSVSAGDAGGININTRQLIVEGGAGIAASGLKTGDSGTVTINASSSVSVSGVGSVNPSLNPSRILSSVGTGDPFISYIYNLTEPPNASSGNVFINTPTLNLSDGAILAVRNESTKDAGTLRVNANTINLKGAEISATTASGEGGDISVFSSVLSLGDSNITATAGGTGNGGNIDIFTDILTASDNSSITANAYEGRGGNIQINTRALVISPDTRIEASSQRGINGTVEINLQQGNLEQTQAQPEAIASSPRITTACQNGSGKQVASTFVNIGTGAVPEEEKRFYRGSGWRRNSEVQRSRDNLTINSEATTIVEAQGWIINANGEVVLTAQVNPTITANNSSSARSCSTNSEK